MKPSPDTVVTHAADITRIEAVAATLRNAERVQLTLQTGGVIVGSVTEHPTVQIFEDANGNQGLNGLLRLDNPAVPGWNAYVWLSDIAAVEILGH